LLPHVQSVRGVETFDVLPRPKLLNRAGTQTVSFAAAPNRTHNRRVHGI
jgi:hypothetical protein